MLVCGSKKLRSNLSKKFLGLLFFGLILLQITSCGESASTDDSIGRTPELQTGCEINEENLDNFYSREIPADIECLRKYLELFVRVVTPDSPETKDKLSQAALEKYIKQKEPDLINVLKYTPLFFNLSHLVFGDQLGYLSKENIVPLTTAAIEINKELALIYPLIKFKPKEELYKIHEKKREIIIQSALRMANSVEKLFKEAPAKEKPLSILETIDIFATADNQQNIAKIKSVAFLKRVLSGGDFYNITQAELRQVIGMFPKLARLGFDLLQFKALIFKNEYQRYKFYGEAIETLEETLYFKDQPSAPLFEVADLENALLNFEDDIGLDNIKSYFSIIPEIKGIFGHSPEVRFLRQDINKILVHVKKLVQYGEAFVDTYYAKNDKTSNQVLLESNNPIVEDLLIHNPIYSKQFKDFARIAKNYRFFRGANPIPFYGPYYSRNLSGMIEAIFIEYLYAQVAGFYEETYPCNHDMFIRLRPFADPKKCDKNNKGQCIEDLRCKNGEDKQKNLSQGQVELIVVKLIDALDELDLASKHMEYSTAETIMLMNDLFQFQSNSNASIDKFEIAEFGSQIISALSMKSNVINALENMCAGQIADLDNGYRVYGANCFRENFLNVLYEKFEKKGKNPGDLPEQFQYSEYLPSLINYLDTPSTPLVSFVHKVEQFTNSCYGYFLKPENEGALPLDDFLYEGDVMGVYGGLFNIESTLTRFDVDPVDNLLVGGEIEVAFSHFKIAVQGLLGDAITGKFANVVEKVIDALGPEEIAKRAFYYMMKYREMPDVKSFDKAMKFAGHMANPKYKNGVVVDRITIAAVLAGIKNSSKNKATPYQLSFNCNKKPLPDPQVNP
jgi:hypothetical protein